MKKKLRELKQKMFERRNMKMRRIFMDSIYVVMPAYNEEENIRKL